MSWTIDFTSGAALRTYRLAAGMTRADLADAAGLHPNTIRYQEAKGGPLRGYAAARLRQVLVGAGIAIPKLECPPSKRAMRAESSLNAAVERTLQRLRDKHAQKIARQTRSITPSLDPDAKLSSRCGARTRKGTACRAEALPGKARCKLHGGASTGAKTPEGRQRIAEAQKRRWAQSEAANL